MNSDSQRPAERSLTPTGLPPSASSVDKSAASSVLVVQFEELAQGATSVQISLGAEIYILRKTHAGKLILNK